MAYDENPGVWSDIQIACGVVVFPCAAQGQGDASRRQENAVWCGCVGVGLTDSAAQTTVIGGCGTLLVRGVIGIGQRIHVHVEVQASLAGGCRSTPKRDKRYGQPCTENKGGKGAGKALDKGRRQHEVLLLNGGRAAGGRKPPGWPRVWAGEITHGAPAQSSGLFSRGAGASGCKGACASRKCSKPCRVEKP